MPHVDNAKLSRIASLKERSNIALTDKDPLSNTKWVEGPDALLLVNSYGSTPILYLADGQIAVPVLGYGYSFSVNGSILSIKFHLEKPLPLYLPITVRVIIKTPRMPNKIIASNIIFLFPEQN